jgi:bifunctional N-acetylglucosamine-1-phosphate-uridyltransferase/glucosamine-1-phosphate-acetyltransferase GlmU-like protein
VAAAWTGIVLARSEPADDRMASRLPAFLHPLAGRPLAWHAVSALAALHPAPSRILLVSDREVSPDPFLDVWEEIRVLERSGEELWSALEEACGPDERFLLVDARAPLLAPGLQALLESPTALFLADDAGGVAAACLDRGAARRRLDAWRGMAALAADVGDAPRLVHEESALVVRDRRALARASELLRDRLVGRLMDAGVSFLLPHTSWVDLDVRIGRDTVVYPGVVLEGQTTIGEETVVGPGCRIVDSWVGSGVELKGWNYLAHTSIRNRAILEPYARRGYD